MPSFFYISSRQNQGLEKGLSHCLLSNILEKILWSNLSLSMSPYNRARLSVPPSLSHVKVRGGKWEVGYVHVGKIRSIL